MTILREIPENPEGVEVHTPEPTAWERGSAAWTVDTVRSDPWNYSGSVLQGIHQEMLDRLPEESRLAYTRADNPLNYDADRLSQVLIDEMAKLPAAGNAGFSEFPTNLEEMQAEVDRRRKAELDEAETLLDIDGGGFAEFVGAGARAMTDETSLMLMPFGVGGSMARVIASEAVLGAAGEALILPREYEVADELDLEDPDPLTRIATGAAFGGGLGAVVSGVPRLLSYGKSRKQALAENRPANLDEFDFGTEVDLAYEQMSGARSEFEIGQVKPKPAGSTTLSMRDFDFSQAGNASPSGNRIGYVFGRLLERGMSPEEAAGFVANFMQESGVGLNTQAVGDNGNAFGMAQWNGPRRRAFLEFARKAGKDAGDLDTQIDFLMHELETSEARAWSKIRGARSAEEAARLVSTEFERPGIPHLANRIAYAQSIIEQYRGGSVPKWAGAVSPSYDGGTTFTGYSSRGYTSTGQVVAGDDIRIDVEYEVVDLKDLKQASGDLQPRDRGRAASDAWVADTAARLDPALLMPSPTADRGAPVVGPDGVIESGNGRVRAIERAYDQHPDRGQAYREQIEGTLGQSIPEGIDQPVLIARRTSDLDASARRKMVVEAQDSGVARMNATERAQVGQRALTADLMALYHPGHKLSSAENRDFARGFSGAFPRSERNAFIDQGGALSTDGVRQLQDAMFARAYDAPDILARYVETEAGELRSLMDALADAAPEVAQLRAEIEAGAIRPEMDITPNVLDAVRMIMTARDLARTEGGSAGKILDELLNDVSLFGDVVHPLTKALVGKFVSDGKQIPAAKISRFLKDYAIEAQKAGKAGDALADAPGPVAVLKAMDKKAFGDLEEIAPGSVQLETPSEPEATSPPAGSFEGGSSAPQVAAGSNAARADLEQSDLIDDLFELEDGTSRSLRDFLDDIDADETAQVVIDACTLGSS